MMISHVHLKFQYRLCNTGAEPHWRDGRSAIFPVNNVKLISYAGISSPIYFLLGYIECVHSPGILSISFAFDALVYLLRSRSRHYCNHVNLQTLLAEAKNSVFLVNLIHLFICGPHQKVYGVLHISGENLKISSFWDYTAV